VVWADTNKFLALFDNAEPQGPTAADTKTYNRAGASVSRYPGDPAPYSRSGGSVTRTFIPRSSGQTTPGRAFTVETPLKPLPGQKVTVRQFTLVGTWSDFFKFAEANALVPMTIRSPGGVPAAIRPD
jgi:hypothetical protein